MLPSFEKVDPDEPRQFKAPALPEFKHTLTQEQLSKVDEITGERWKLDNVMGQKIDWVIRTLAELGEALVKLETEVIRSKQFRRWLWLRITFFTTVAIALLKLFGLL